MVISFLVGISSISVVTELSSGTSKIWLSRVRIAMTLNLLKLQENKRFLNLFIDNDLHI